MLKNISPVLSPNLLKILMEMGHGDEIVIGDGNFPAASVAKRLIRLDGHGVRACADDAGHADICAEYARPCAHCGNRKRFYQILQAAQEGVVPNAAAYGKGKEGVDQRQN